MRLLKTAIHSSLNNHSLKNTLQRRATRAIILRGADILLVYTQRYDDYALPGGGLDDNEDLLHGFVRELKEETGALNIRNIQEFGFYEEYRPHFKNDFDSMHMLSYCFTCDIDDALGETQLEDYEISNGMKPVWLNIYDAIAHNEHTMAHSEKQGLSIERETFLLKLIAKELLETVSELAAVS